MTFWRIMFIYIMLMAVVTTPIVLNVLELVEKRDAHLTSILEEMP